MSELTELYQEIAHCKRCDLYKTRSRTVPGEGPENAEIMFIGEAPGFHEDREGRPFVGQAGQFLNQLLGSIGLKRQEVYITNVIKSRPPENRDPLPVELTACRPWLDKQLELIKPKIIITLGRYSMGMFFPGKTISKIHGQAEKCGAYTCFPVYHPAAALHQNSLRAVIEADMLKVPKIIEDMKKGAAAQKKAPPPTQLNFGF